MELKVLKAQRVLRDHKDLLVMMVLKAHKVLRVFKVLLAMMD